MTQEQFGQFWDQLKTPLRKKWERITNDDIAEIQGNMENFGRVLQRRYGELHKEQVDTWAHRRYCHWAGNYAAYTDPEPEA